MSDDEQLSPDAAVALSDEELRRIRDAISARFGVRLRPGETLFVDAGRTAEEVWVRLEISLPDDTFRFEIECAAVRRDAPVGSEWAPGAAFDEVLDMLDTQLLEYFENDRFLPLHDDWRVYESDGFALRLRGRESQPNLETLADEWLAMGGARADSGDGEPN